MTTPAAERLYRAQHEHRFEGARPVVFNPHGRPPEELPAIYGFNNGGSDHWYSGVILAEDGTCLGGHACSHEAYMPADLGVIPGGLGQSRHAETFEPHYPDGYRMEFVSMDDVKGHAGLMEAYRKNQEQAKANADPE
jgi:hypothetical protein